jgi:hypothetical protein
MVVVEPGHDLEQRALARAVRAQHADLRAREERERDVLEDHAVDADDLADLLHRVDELVRHNGSIMPVRAAYSIGLVLALLTPAHAQSAHPEVVVIVNDASPVSLAIGEAYRAQRGVPSANVVHLQIPQAEERIDRAGYTARVREPVARFLRENDARGRIRILVTTTGVPCASKRTIAASR